MQTKDSQKRKSKTERPQKKSINFLSQNNNEKQNPLFIEDESNNLNKSQKDNSFLPKLNLSQSTKNNPHKYNKSIHNFASNNNSIMYNNHNQEILSYRKNKNAQSYDQIRLKTIQGLEMVDKIDVYKTNGEQNDRMTDSQLISGLTTNITQRSKGIPYTILQEDRYSTIELFKETKYAKINCENKYWPMKIRVRATEGVYQLCMSFIDAKPDIHNSIIDFPKRKEHLFKFYKPKHYNPTYAFISVSSKGMAKIEMKGWFTEPEIEKWRFVTKYMNNNNKISDLKRVMYKKPQVDDGDEKKGDGEDEENVIIHKNAYLEYLEEQRKLQETTMNQTNYLSFNKTMIKDPYEAEEERKLKIQEKLKKQTENFNRAKMNQVKSFMENVQKNMVRELKHRHAVKKNQRLKKLKSLNNLMVNWGTIMMVTQLYQKLKEVSKKEKQRLLQVKFAEELALQIKSQQKRAVFRIEKAYMIYAKKRFRVKVPQDRLKMDILGGLELVAGTLQEQQQKRMGKTINYIIQKVKVISAQHKALQLKQSIIRLWKHRIELNSAQYLGAKMIFQNIKQQMLDEDSQKKDTNDRDNLSYYFTQIGKKQELLLIKQFIKEEKLKLKKYSEADNLEKSSHDTHPEEDEHEEDGEEHHAHEKTHKKKKNKKINHATTAKKKKRNANDSKKHSVLLSPDDPSSLHASTRSPRNSQKPVQKPEIIINKEEVKEMEKSVNLDAVQENQQDENEYAHDDELYGKIYRYLKGQSLNLVKSRGAFKKIIINKLEEFKSFETRLL